MRHPGVPQKRKMGPREMNSKMVVVVVGPSLITTDLEAIRLRFGGAVCDFKSRDFIEIWNHCDCDFAMWASKISKERVQGGQNTNSHLFGQNWTFQSSDFIRRVIAQPFCSQKSFREITLNHAKLR